MLPQRFYDTAAIRRHSDGETHFFAPSSMRFFRSRIGQNAYVTVNPYKTLFVTSEQFIDSRGNADRRLYTVRSYDCRTYDIDTIGKFQEYRTARAANKSAEDLALEIPFPIEDQQEYALALNLQYEIAKRRAIVHAETKFYVTDLGYVSLLTNRHFFNLTEG